MLYVLTFEVSDNARKLWVRNRRKVLTRATLTCGLDMHVTREMVNAYSDVFPMRRVREWHVRTYNTRPGWRRAQATRIPTTHVAAEDFMVWPEAYELFLLHMEMMQ